MNFKILKHPFSVAAIGFLILALAFFIVTKVADHREAVRVRNRSVAPLPPPPVDERVEWALANIEAAERFVAGGQCDNAADLSKAWKGLRIVRAGDEFYSRATSLIAPLEKCRQYLLPILLKQHRQEMVARREALAASVERAALERGFDYYTSLSGEFKDTLVIKFQFADRVHDAQLMQGGKIHLACVQAGISRLILTNGGSQQFVHEFGDPDGEKFSQKMAELALSEPLEIVAQPSRS